MSSRAWPSDPWTLSFISVLAYIFPPSSLLISSMLSVTGFQIPDGFEKPQSQDQEQQVIYNPISTWFSKQTILHDEHLNPGVIYCPFVWGE